MTATDNPLLNHAYHGGIPDFTAITADHVVPALTTLLQQARTELTQLAKLGPEELPELLDGLEVVGDGLGRAWGVVDHILAVRDSEPMRQAQEALQADVVAFSLEIGQNSDIFRTFTAASAQLETLSAADARTVTQQLLAARLAGVALTGDQKAEFLGIQQQLAELSTTFAHHVLDATKAFALDISDVAETAGWPSSLRQQTAAAWAQAHATADHNWETGPWRVTLDGACVVPVLRNSAHRPLREAVYRAYAARATSGDLDNAPILLMILHLRHRQAQLLGFADYADQSLASKMAPSAGAVVELLEQLRQSSWTAGLQDLEDLRSWAKQQGAAEAEALQPWDVGYWAERLREQRYDYNDEALRPYFPLPRVLTGLFALAKDLFGIEVKACTQAVPLWHPDVQYFNITGPLGEPIGSFFLDAYSRPATKRGGAWMNECLGRSAVLGTPGQPRLPVAYLVCNGTPPVAGQPSLMTFGEVETLFHEFGHGLQHMLTRVDRGQVAGISGIEWDAVELPSQFMENWCYHAGTMARICGHWQTGEALPPDIFAKICAARTYRAGSDMLRQVGFALTDWQLHSGTPPETAEAVFDLARQVAMRTAALPPLAGDRSLCAFSHIFGGGYAAGYYSYKWAEVLSADAFGAFEEAGQDDPTAIEEVGLRFRETVLALGGSVPPMDVYVQFRGRPPTVAALLRHAGLKSGPG